MSSTSATAHKQGTTTNADATVVIPCFNYGRFLPEAVASVRAQTGGPPHVIVVDDGSTEPETLRTLDVLGDDDEIEVVRRANAGVAATRNAGMALATTPYVMCLDADDRLAPDALTAMRERLDARPDLGFAYGQLWLFGDREGLVRFPPFDPWILLWRHTIGPTALMRIELVRATGGFDPAFDHWEDWEIWIHALATGRVGERVEVPGLLYRKHGPSKFDQDRRRFRVDTRRLREKHADLYSRRDEIARRSSLSAPRRAFYRWFWGERPWPAQAEAALYSLLWRRADGR